MQITNKLNLPQPFVSAVSSEYAYTDKRYSVTSIIKGTREAILQRRHDDEIEQDVADMAWLIFGTAVHSVLEDAQETDTQLKENKIVQPLENGYELSGIFDLYDDSTGTVTDYKTAAVWKVIYNDWEDYRKQTLLYCWMLRRMGFDAHRGEIVALLKDHSKSKAEHESGYPKFPIYRIGWEFSDSDFAEVETWLSQKFTEIDHAEKLPDSELPLCTPEERWAKPTIYAVTKRGNKKATKLFNEKSEADRYASELTAAQGKQFDVIKRQGEDVKCAKYCSVCDFCDYGMTLKGGE